MLIYVSGPYSASTLKERLSNVKIACMIGAKLDEKGHSPVIPHTLHYLSKYTDQSNETWLRIGIGFLMKCDALYFIGPSPGANQELEVAKRLKIPIYYGLDEVR